MTIRDRVLAACCLLLTGVGVACADSARVYFRSDRAPEIFAVDEIEAALRARQFSVTRRDVRDSHPFRDEALIYFDTLDGGRPVSPGKKPPVDVTKIRAEGF